MSRNRIFVSGMTCSNCERKIESKLKALDGIIEVEARYSRGTVHVTYDENRVNLAKIKREISAIGYKAEDNPQSRKTEFYQIAVVAIILLGIYVVMDHFGGFDFFGYFPEAKEGMSYAAVFVIGLLTSVHCIGMCGGINLSQCVGVEGNSRMERIRPSFLYNIGRVLSYTVIGGVVGAIGSVVAFNGFMRGAVALVAGVFMVIMGLNMLNIFPWLKRFGFRLPRFLTGNTRSNSPLYVGILNGLMPCGPLQAMQLYALSTGSAMQGAVSMFLFAIGTMPLLFGFGAVSSFLSKRFTAKIMRISAVLIVILGVGMFNTGLSMSGFLAIGTEQSDTAGFEPVMVDGYQMVEGDVARRAYTPITVKKGIPVKWNLRAESQNLNGCNNVIVIPDYDIAVQLQSGDNMIEFTPTETGVIPYSCWMNMIRSSITVVE